VGLPFDDSRNYQMGVHRVNGASAEAGNTRGLLSNGKIEVGESVFVVPWYCCPVCISISIISISDGNRTTVPRAKSRLYIIKNIKENCDVFLINIVLL
jgi:hypothetical protein